MHPTFALIDWENQYKYEGSKTILCLNEGWKSRHIMKCLGATKNTSLYFSSHCSQRSFAADGAQPLLDCHLVQTATPFSKNLSSPDVATVCFKGSRGCICTPAGQRLIPELLSTKQLCSCSYKESVNEVQPPSWYQCTVCAQHADICRKCVQSDFIFFLHRLFRLCFTEKHEVKL